MKRFRQIAVTAAAIGCVAWMQTRIGAAQTKPAPRQASSGTKCTSVKPANAQEAVMMEQSSNKNGCWARNKDGHLIFLSDSPPAANYKSLLGSPSAAPPAELQAPPPQLAGDAVGSWKVTLTTNTKISGNVWHKGVLVITPALEVKFKCELTPSLDLNAWSWTGPPRNCSEGGVRPYGVNCHWKLSKASAGLYNVGCADNKTSLKGKAVVSGNNISLKAVDSADEYLIWTFSLWGTRNVSLPAGR